MEREKTLSVMVLVKAAPVPTAHGEERMCVAAMGLGSKPRWIRLYPVPFRDLDDDNKFRKFQEITVRAIRPDNDRRPESWTPMEGSIDLGPVLGLEHGWSARRERIAKLGEHTTCELIELNRAGSGPETPSLAVVRTLDPPELLIDRRDHRQLNKWRERADAITAQRSLFDDPQKEHRSFEVVPWRFRYSYRCLAMQCNGHKSTIIDWEIVALWRNVRHRDNWKDLMRTKFVGELGTQAEIPRSS